MGQQQSVAFITMLLALTAGYCDTVTFVSASGLFSAHVTGNFILFAYDLVKHADAKSWLKLLSLPVFIVAVIIGGIIASRSAKAYSILLVEGLILLISGIISIMLSVEGVTIHLWISYFLAMCVVFSMGLQNAFGKIYPKETYATTTMMTGNVTQAALDLGKILRNKCEAILTKVNLYHQAITIACFLAGCLSGGFIGKNIGLPAVLLPGIVLVIYSGKTIKLTTFDN